MEDEKYDYIISGKTIAKNTIYNILGYAIPLIISIAFIPILITGLGIERFGILNLAWIIIGYFSFFDFGIGRALTKIIAEKIGLNKKEEIPSIFWTSFFLMFIISLLGTIGLFFLIPTLVYKFFTISKALEIETLYTFYVLAISIPIVTSTAGLRGVLEAYQKFGILNIIRIILGVFTFLGPLICLFFINSLFWIVVFLTLIRIIIWFLYLMQCFLINKELKQKIKIEPKLIKPIFIFSGWITISNFMGPLITYLDRFLIGSLLTVTAISYYATPYEIVTKLLIIPGAVIGVLFPIFSTSFLQNSDFSKKVYLRGIKYIILFLYPVILLIITFSYEAMNLWVGRNFAENSYFILQLLAVGVFINSIAYVPYAFLQGIGKPEIIATINLIEFPIYVILLWITIIQWGLNGAAIVFIFRTLVETILLIFINMKLMKIKFESGLIVLSIFFLTLSLLIPMILSDLVVKIFFNIGWLLIFLCLSWRYFLEKEEKLFIKIRVKMIYSFSNGKAEKNIR